MIEIIDSTTSHVRELRKTLRDNDKLEATRVGLDPFKAIFIAYTRAVFRKTVLVNGRVAAMYGVVGTPLGLVGMPYLITGTVSEEVSPLTFARVYKQGVEEMSSIFSVLENYVDASYLGAVRLLKISGFSLSEPVQINGFDFLRFTLRTDS